VPSVTEMYDNNDIDLDLQSCERENIHHEMISNKSIVLVLA